MRSITRPVDAWSCSRHERPVNCGQHGARDPRPRHRLSGATSKRRAATSPCCRAAADIPKVSRRPDACVGLAPTPRDLRPARCNVAGAVPPGPRRGRKESRMARCWRTRARRPGIRPNVRRDGLDSTRPGSFGGPDYGSTRSSAAAGWGEPVNLGPAVTSAASETRGSNRAGSELGPDRSFRRTTSTRRSASAGESARQGGERT